MVVFDLIDGLHSNHVALSTVTCYAIAIVSCHLISHLNRIRCHINTCASWVSWSSSSITII